MYIPMSYVLKLFDTVRKSLKKRITKHFDLTAKTAKTNSISGMNCKKTNNWGEGVVKNFKDWRMEGGLLGTR